MAKTPWMNSQDIIDAVTRKIAFPISQNTFTNDDILKFVDEEMFISQVPSVLQYHEEYYVTFEVIQLIPNQNRYAIPNRSIGMKIRDAFWSDNQPIPGQPYGNLFELAKILPDDKSYWQRNAGSNQQIHKFYLENNDMVLMPPVNDQVVGSLVLSFYLRPNQLVMPDRAAIITSFKKNITVTNANLAVGDIVAIAGIQFTIVASSPTANQFVIGASDALTAINLANAINNNGTVGTAMTTSNIVVLDYNDINYSFASTSLGLVIEKKQQIAFSSIPSNITNNSYVDILQTNGGHKTIDYDILLSSTAVSGNVITFNYTDIFPATNAGTSSTYSYNLDPNQSSLLPYVPSNLRSEIVVGDYVCSQYECIIPYLPSDLHTGLAERAAARILAAIGDTEGLNNSNARIADIEKHQGNLIDNRDEGSAKKVISRHSLLHFGSMGSRRKL